MMAPLKQLECVVSGAIGLDVQRAGALRPSLVFTVTFAPSVYWKLSFFYLRELKSVASATVVTFMPGQLKETNIDDSCFQSLVHSLKSDSF